MPLDAALCQPLPSRERKWASLLGLLSVSQAEGRRFHRVIIEDFENPRPETIPDAKKREFQIEIVEKDGELIWTSRDGKSLVKAGRSGLFETWLAPDGAGYVRLAPQAAIDPTADSNRYMYVEHLVNRLGSVTYWGFGYLAR